MNIVKLIKKCFTKNTPIIKSIVAVDMNNGIGKDGNLLFPISADMKHFVASTRGDAVIMRSGTFESFSKRPLKNRLNIVISRRKNYDGNGAQVVQTLDAALDL
ncbi:MAG: dihydrofolate reductase, partial [Minisyncoccia bacterium]